MDNPDFDPILKSITADKKITPEEARAFMDFYEANKGGPSHYTRENLAKLRTALDIHTDNPLMTELERGRLREIMSQVVVGKVQKKTEQILKTSTVSGIEKTPSPRKQQKTIEPLRIPSRINGRGIWSDIVLRKWEIEMFAKMIWGEAEGETRSGRRRVAEVILFRVMDGDYGGKRLRNVLHKKSGNIYEFSPMEDSRYKKAPILQDIVDLIKQVLGEGKSIFGNERPLFFQSKAIKNGWIDKNRKLVYTGEDSGHNFYA